jgi:hypothetical protein
MVVMVRCLALSILLIATGCGKSRSEKPVPTEAVPHGTSRTNAVPADSSWLISAGDLKSAGVAGDFSRDDLREWNWVGEHYLHLSDEIMQLFKEAGLSSSCKLVELEVSDYQELDRLMMENHYMFRISRLPVVCGRECASGKFISIDMWNHDRLIRLCIMKEPGFSWTVVSESGVLH